MSREWPEERAERLKALFAAGLTQTQMAKALMAAEPGFRITKNGVNGQCARRGLIRGREAAILASAISNRSRMPKPPTPPPAQKGEVGLRTLITLEPGECRFPLGDPQAPDFALCGAQARPKRDYCAMHDRLTHVPASAVARLDERLGIADAVKGGR